MKAPTLELVEGSTGRLQNLVVDSTQTPLIPTDVDTLSARVYDTSSGKFVKLLLDNVIDASPYIFATLRTTNGWTRNTTGYNFEYVVAKDAFRNLGGRSYRIEFEANTSTERVRWAWNVVYTPWFGR